MTELVADLKADAYQKVLGRIELLSGCLEDTPEERRLIELVETAKRFEDVLRNLVDRLSGNH